MKHLWNDSDGKTEVPNTESTQFQSVDHKCQTSLGMNLGSISNGMNPINMSKQNCTQMDPLHGANLYLVINRTQNITLPSVDNSVNNSTISVQTQNISDMWSEMLVMSYG